MKHLLTATALLGLLLSLAAGSAFAEAEINVTSGLTAKGAGLAVHGYDVVAYFVDGRPIRGDAKFSSVYQGATYRFASRKNLRSFEADPDRYVPQYGGYCAYGVSVGAKFDGDPEVWRIVDDHLYLNLNQDIQNTWKKDIPGNIDKADGNWREIADKSPADLQ